ncbi:MAG: hypothetical protein H6835_02275 [Planctomycetes bacterium]|nr:hypothetical protein [Planctomycetota bacterium]
MKRTILCLALPVLAVLPGCLSTSYEQPYIGADDYELARTETSDGAKEVFSLENGRSLRVRTDYERVRPFLGLKVVQLDKAHAEPRGVEPYSGLLVTGTYPDSSARLAGMLEHDVLLSLDGKPVVYLEQLTEVESGLADAEAVVARVLRGQQEIEVTLRAKLLRESVSDSQLIALDRQPASPRPYAGVELRGIPPAWCERMFGAPCNAVVLTGVTLGSPAWLAGFRGGDVIEQVDGEPVPSVDELARRIAVKGSAGQRMHWLVRRRPDEIYEADVRLRDYSGETYIGIPLLLGMRSSPEEERFSLLWGLLMGNRNVYVPDNTTREVETRNVFSAVLGLVRVDSGPHQTEVRLLWFIRFVT